MVIVDLDEGGGSGAEVGSVAALPVLVNVRPPARLIERATAEWAGRVELPWSITTTNGAQVALADAQPADGGGDHELARAVVLRPSCFGRPRPSQARAIIGHLLEQGDHLLVLGVRDVSEPVLAVGSAGEPDGCLAAINATCRPCSAWESPHTRHSIPG